MIKYTFEKSPKPKGKCPKCNQHKKFRYYEGLPREFGKCDRESECQYHNKPDAEALKNLGVDTNLGLTSQVKIELKTVFPSDNDLKCLNNLNSPFHTFCFDKLKITKEHLQKWKVGSEGQVTKFIYSLPSGKNINVITIHYQISSDEKNCKRIKAKPPYSLKPNKGEKYELCLFGEHLLSNKIICLVESEKTAVIASFVYPEFDWIATGGANKLTDDKISALFNKEVYYLNDADKAGKENSTIKKLIAYKLNYKIIDLFPDRNDGYDLADAIIDGNKPEIKPVEKIKSENEIETECFDKYGFFVRNNEYYIKQQIKHYTKDLKISNFTMKWIYRLNDESDNIPMLFELIKEDKSTMLLEITSKDLLTSTNFSAIVLKGGFNYNGTTFVFKNIIESLYDESKEAIYLSTLGQNLENDFYSFFNGVLKINGEYKICDEHGVVELDNKYFYLPSGKKGNENNVDFVDDRKFKFTPGTLTLSLFVEKIYNIYEINGLIGLCYTIATIHRDIIFSETKFFPFLFLYGGKGSGKSTYINFFMNFFGDPQPETTENSTDKAIERKFAQINNNLQYIKEFNPTFEDKIKDILKNAYDGVGYSRAQVSQNNKTKTSIVRSGLAIDGNYFPTKDDALFSRLIFMLWQPTFSDKTKEDTQDLQDLFKAGNGLIFSDIYKQREVYKDGFSKLYRQTIIELKTLCRNKKINFSEREISHIALMAVVFKLSLKEILPSDLAYTMFVDFLIKGAQKQTQITQSIDDVNKFLEALNTLHQRSILMEQKHFVREQSVGFDYLYINFNLCQLEYAKYIKETGDAFNISKEGLKQKLEFSASKNYPYTKPNELYFQKKFMGVNQRCFVLEVEPWTFDLLGLQ
ncbi:MAG: DUF6371 domain-containing protein [Bacteroidota bacterium]|nr:DUF6371 domain-containing protein [Bacteroidota bacterium]MDP3144284.1 DUF6371 domain-containing protein [Bacteroidota bacterium]